MTLALLYWILMLLWLILGMYWNWPADRDFRPLGGNFLLFILLLLLGIASFGSPIK